jgi:hypothetical protein
MILLNQRAHVAKKHYWAVKRIVFLALLVYFVVVAILLPLLLAAFLR